MDRSALEAKEPTARFGGVYVETYRGYKIGIKRGAQVGTLSLTIGGEPAGVVFGRTNADALRQANCSREYIDDSHERPDAYIWSRKSS